MLRSPKYHWLALLNLNTVAEENKLYANLLLQLLEKTNFLLNGVNYRTKGLQSWFLLRQTLIQSSVCVKAMKTLLNPEFRVPFSCSKGFVPFTSHS